MDPSHLFWQQMDPIEDAEYDNVEGLQSSARNLLEAAARL